MSNKKQEQPPPPPEVARKFQLHRWQMIGIPLIMLIPILALFGLFGETSHSVSSASPQVEMQVTYPTRFRYKMISPGTVTIENISTQPLLTVTISFDRAYIDNFSNVTFTPDVNFITESAYVVELTALQPQEARTISIELQAEQYGRHQGLIRAAPADAPPVQLALDTFVFP